MENIIGLISNWNIIGGNMMTKSCPKCKTENSDEAGFCQSCGTELKNVTGKVKTGEPSGGGITAWWNKQSNGGKAAIGVVGVCCIGLILIVAIGGILSPDKTTTTSPTTTTPTTTTTSTPATSTFQPINLSGSGEKATQSFNWPGGMMRIEMTHNGDSNFIIHLVRTSDGEIQEFVENEIGPVNGSRVFSVPAGNYLLDVQADGKWNVIITK